MLNRVYVHSAVLQWKRCLHSVQLPSAVVALRFVVCHCLLLLCVMSRFIVCQSWLGLGWSYHIVLWSKFKKFWRGSLYEY